MQTRSLVPMGLALVSLAGCQSYFPNSYNSSGMYPAFPAGTYGPPPGNSPPNSTYQPGRAAPADPSKANASPKNGDPLKGPKPVPNYKEPGSRTPNTLGTPVDEDDEIFRRPQSSLEQNPSRRDQFADRPEDTDEEEFAIPRRVKPASASAVDIGSTREVHKPKPSLFRCDRKGYTWLRGVVLRDAQSNGWRLKYSDDPTDGDMYGGVLRITGDEKIDLLIEGDTIRVEGEVDANATDRFGKPTYRVHLLEWMRPKSSDGR